MYVQASLHEQIGSLNCDLGDKEQARRFLDSSLTIYKQLEKKESLPHIKAIYSLGLMYTTFGEIQPALKYLIQAKDLIELGDGQDGEFYVMVLYNLSLIYHKQQNIENSLKLLSDAEIIASKGEISTRNMCKILEHKGNVMMALQKDEEARECISKALGILKAGRSTNDPLYARLLHNQGFL